MEKRRIRKGDRKSLCGRKGKRENEMWKKRRKEGEGEERRGREKRTENGENDTRGASPSPDAFPSAKLGNNITPIKGRLGKNTTPTSRSPTKLNQNLQVDPRRRRSSFDASSHTDLSRAPKRQNIQSINFIAMKPPFIRRPRHSEIRANASNSP